MESRTKGLKWKQSYSKGPLDVLDLSNSFAGVPCKKVDSKGEARGWGKVTGSPPVLVASTGEVSLGKQLLGALEIIIVGHGLENVVEAGILVVEFVDVDDEVLGTTANSVVSQL